MSKQNIFFLSVLSICISVVLSIIILTANAEDNPNRTESVFVYGTLTNPVIRAVACRCITAGTAITLMDYKKVGLNITPQKGESVSGLIINVDSTELSRLNSYESIPDKYRLEKIIINDKEHWVYIRN